MGLITWSNQGSSYLKRRLNTWIHQIYSVGIIEGNDHLTSLAIPACSGSSMFLENLTTN